MFTTDAMDRYIEESARAFLKEAKPLNETITKIASEHGLNHDQIARVVEGANTEVYVQLMNQSSDKYVQFENASAEKVASAVHGTEKIAEIITDDYDSLPQEETLEGSFLEKIASEEEKPFDHTIVHQQAVKLAGLDEQLGNSLDEVDIRFQQNTEILYHLVKQAYLGGTSFGDIRSAVNAVYDSPVVTEVLKECQEKLAEEIYPKQLILAETNHGSVNSENPIIKQAGALVKDTQEFVTLREKRAEVYEGMRSCAARFPETKHLLKSAMPAAEVAKKGLSAGKKIALIGGTGLVGGLALEHHMTEYKKNQASMPMGAVPVQYAR
jgi:hypothetical protein